MPILLATDRNAGLARLFEPARRNPRRSNAHGAAPVPTEAKERTPSGFRATGQLTTGTLVGESSQQTRSDQCAKCESAEASVVVFDSIQRARDDSFGRRSDVRNRAESGVCA